MPRSLIIFCFALIMMNLSVRAQSVGGICSGGATYCSSTNSGFLSITGYVGAVQNWESTTDGGVTWTTIGNTTPTQSYLNLTVTTCYRAIVQSGSFPPDTSTISCITIYAPSNGGVLSGGGNFCGTSGPGTLNITGNTGSITNWIFSTDGGSTWTPIADTNTFIAYPGITVNTMYAAIAQNAACPVDTSNTVTFTIVSPSVGGSVASDDTVCSALNSGILNLSGINGSVTDWLASTDGGVTWTSLSSTSSSFPYSGLMATTTYAAIVQNGICPADTSGFATITVLSPPSVSAGADTTISPGESVVLSGSGTGIPFWSPASTLDSASVFGPTATPPLSTVYTLTVTDANGCSSSDDVTITVVAPEFNGQITSLFTPNGDGVNDFWYIQDIQSYTETEVTVFNAYGQTVYSQNDYQNDWKGTWNGKDLPDGTYYYVLKLNKEDKVFKGSLDILRNK